MILLTGAAGKTGKAIIRSLSDYRLAVKALVFRPEQIQPVKALGVKQVFAGDLTNKEIVRNALQDVDSVYLICPNIHPEEIKIGKLIIDSAIDAGIRHFVYHSVLHPQVEAMPHHWKKMRVEELIFASGLPFTILQPTVYMQNILPDLNQIIASGRYRNPYSVECRISYVDLEDVAQAAAIVLNNSIGMGFQQDHIGATYELVGTQAMTQIEIASILSRELSRPVKAESLPSKTWKRKATDAGMSGYQSDTLVEMFEYYDRYGLVGNPNILSILLGRPTTSFEAFIERTLQDGTIIQH